MIACLTIPYLAAAVARRDDAALAQTPLVIGGAAWEPRPLYAYSREARQHGVRPGMLLRQAALLYPPSHFLPDDPPGYRRAAAEAAALLAGFAPRLVAEPAWEPPAPRQPFPSSNLSLPARYYLDLEGLPLPEALPLAQEIGRCLRAQTRLEPAIGLAEHKFAAQVAAAYTRPNHIHPVPPAAAAAYLAQRPLSLLPLPPETARRLRLLGIHTLGQFLRLPLAALLTQCGPDIRPLYELAHGAEAAPLPSLPPAPTATAARRFDAPIANAVTLAAALAQMGTELAAQLHASAQIGGRVRIQWEQERGAGGEHDIALRQPTADPDRLTLCLQEWLAQAHLRCGLTAIRVTVSHLTPARARQLSLFHQPSPGDLATLVARLQARFGAALFIQASLPAPAHPLLEQRSAWRVIP